VDADAAAGTAEGGVTNVENRPAAVGGLAEQTVDARSMRDDGIGQPELVQHGKRGRLDHQSGTQCAWLLEAFEHGHAVAVAVQQQGRGKTPLARAGDGNIERFVSAGRRSRHGALVGEWRCWHKPLGIRLWGTATA
jgi:hypothetical protein